MATIQGRSPSTGRAIDVAVNAAGSVIIGSDTLAVDVRVPMIGMLQPKAEELIVDTALQEVKQRVQSVGGEARRQPGPTLGMCHGG